MQCQVSQDVLPPGGQFFFIAGAAAKPELTPQANGNKTLIYRSDPPEWRTDASVAYFKDKFYYLGGDTNRADSLMDGGVKRYIDYQTMNGNGLKSERFQKDEIHSELHR
ncbi:hypothetical protein WR25_20399 [Diploscapter pachys]|uniref:Uncharacterized protein n=1 Tax=Diploscapter pachys TaxID=2018661 RepID=A0A2A2JLV7_9BILA|nr:hypothetical protein WR25_20399 [Diploscapter pachys]